MGTVVEFESTPVRSVYLDANATTPLLPDVLNAMMPWYFSRCGNASSSHARGRESRDALEMARAQVADLIGAQAGQIVFTSGGTEADNLAIFGTAVEPGAHIITSNIEHHAVLHAVERLRSRLGWTVTYLDPDENGTVNPEDVRRAIRRKTRLISVMMANNETGVLQSVEEIGHIARERGVLFHTDAVQALGKVPIDVKRIGCDLLSLSAHKMHGPQGAGALFVREGVKLDPMLVGGAQEADRRAGTENVAAIVGFGAAAEIARKGFKDGSMKRMERLRDELERSLLREAETAGVNGARNQRVPNTTNLWFGGAEGGRLIHVLDRMGVAVSGGSACTASSCEPSHVLLAMGLSPSRASASIRFSLSKQTSMEDIDFVIWQVSEALENLRSGRSIPPSRRRVPLPQNA
ncbi:MAG TPA: cysteine desulfurase family protein [Terracidiphilus sp.]|jgi:cysteine desulfurase